MDDDIVSTVVQELGESLVRVAPVEEGLLNETYELSCDGGEYVLQFSSNADDGPTVLRHGLNWHIRLQNSEIPVPSVVTGRINEFNERTYILVEKLLGETGERAISLEKVLNAGRHLAKVHNIRSFDTA